MDSNKDYQAIRLMEYAEKHIAGILAESGFSKHNDSPLRWYKVGGGVIFSVILLLDRGNTEFFFGFQPMFYPFHFLNTYFSLHDRFSVYFDASMWFRRLHPENARMSAYAAGVSAMLQAMILPIFRRINDLETCHDVYKALFWGLNFDDPTDCCDMRYLFESIALKQQKEVRRFAEHALRKMIYKNNCPDFPLFVGDKPEFNITADQLYRMLVSGNVAPLEQYMSETKKRVEKRLLRAKIPISECISWPDNIIRAKQL